MLRFCAGVGREGVGEGGVGVCTEEVVVLRAGDGEGVCWLDG